MSACYMKNGKEVLECPQSDARHCSGSPYLGTVSYSLVKFGQKNGVHLITIPLPIVFLPSYHRALVLKPIYEVSLPVLLR